MLRLSILLISTLVCLDVALGQDWKNGQLTLKDGTTYTGKFTLEKFGALEVVRHQKERGQNTFPVDKVEALSMWTYKDTTEYRCLNFDLPELKAKPAILFRVLYESDSLKLFEKDVKSLGDYFHVYPIPGLAILISRGKRLENRNVLLMCKEDINELTIVNKPEKERNNGLIKINEDIVYEKFLVSHEDEMLTFYKKNNIDWRFLEDFIDSVVYYDQLRSNN